MSGMLMFLARADTPWPEDEPGPLVLGVFSSAERAQAALTEFHRGNAEDATAELDWHLSPGPHESERCSARAGYGSGWLTYRVIRYVVDEEPGGEDR